MYWRLGDENVGFEFSLVFNSDRLNMTTMEISQTLYFFLKFRLKKGLHVASSTSKVPTVTEIGRVNKFFHVCKCSPYWFEKLQNMLTQKYQFSAS